MISFWAALGFLIFGCFLDEPDYKIQEDDF